MSFFAPHIPQSAWKLFKSLDIQCCFHKELAVFGRRAITSSATNSVLFVSFHLQAFVSLFEGVRNLLYDLLTLLYSFMPVFFLPIQGA